MKLLFYTHYFPPSVGGVEIINLSLTRGLAELRTPAGAPEVEVTVVTQTRADSFDDRALPFRVVRKPGFCALARLVRGADVMHIAGPSVLPMLLGWMMRKPVVIEHHGYQATCPNGLLIHEPDKVICQGHFVPKRYRECLRCLAEESRPPKNFLRLGVMKLRYWLVRKVAANVAITEYVMERQALPHSEVIYHGIEDPQSAIDRAPMPESRTAKPFFAFVGRFVPEKGIAVLLRAVGRLAAEGYEFELRLIGDGSLRSEIEREIQSEGIRHIVTITGFLRGAKLNSALNGSEAVVMPSMWEETAGLSAIEQMMRGKLVIASAIGGLQEVLGNSGMTFPAGDVSALADCMREVLQNPQFAQQLGANARTRSLKLFRRQRMIEDHANLYRRLFDKR